MKLKYILSIVTFGFCMVSCSNDTEESIGGESVTLQINTEIQTTRAGIDATQFENNDKIGLFLFKTGQMNSSCNNVLASTNDNGNTWNISKQISLSQEPAVVYAYYPWQESVNSENGISINLDIASQINYLYGISNGVNEESPVANIKFKHALAKMGFHIQNEEKVKVSKVVISGNKLITACVFDVIEGSCSHESYGTITSKNVDQVSESLCKAYFLLAPMVDQNLTLRVEYSDGKEYVGSFMVPDISIGQNVFYNVNINNAKDQDPQMTISEASIEEWSNCEDLNAVSATEYHMDANGHEYVDLGLPSGTLWATCNVGASSPEEYGNYFAWGETEPKEDYSWETYKWCEGSEKTFTKYCTWDIYGTVDNKIELELADDAARANWGGTWLMPTMTQIEELSNGCTWAWTTLNDIPGYMINSKYNGNSIFLPAAGHKETSIVDAEKNGEYWSCWGSDVYAEVMRFYNFSYLSPYGIGSRNEGYPVRPVLRK